MVVVVEAFVVMVVMVVVMVRDYLTESYRNHCCRECHQVDHGGVEEVERFGIALVMMRRRGGMYWTEQHSVITQDVPHFVPQQIHLIKHIRICLF